MRPLPVAAALLLAVLIFPSSASAQDASSHLRPPLPQTSLVASGPGTAAAGSGINCPGQSYLAMDWLGNLFRVDDPYGLPTTVLVQATGVTLLFDFAVDPTTGYYYGLRDFGTGTELVRFDPTTFVATNLGSLPFPQLNAMDFSFSGSCYVRGSMNGSIYKIDIGNLSGILLASPNGPGTAGDLAVDLDGSIVSLLSNGDVDRYDPATGVHTVLGNHGLGGSAFGFEIDCDGRALISMNDGRLYQLDLVNMGTTLLGSMTLPLNSQIFGSAFTLPADIDEIGNKYCSAATNSTGAEGSIRAFGSQTATDNTLILQAEDLPPAQFAYFIGAQSQTFVPLAGGSQGNLCVGSPTARFNSQVGPTGTGIYAITLDLSDVPLPPAFGHTVAAGETWNFQCWYRDANPMSTSNFSDGISILYQ